MKVDWVQYSTVLYYCSRRVIELQHALTDNGTILEPSDAVLHTVITVDRIYKKLRMAATR